MPTFETLVEGHCNLRFPFAGSKQAAVVIENLVGTLRRHNAPEAILKAAISASKNGEVVVQRVREIKRGDDGNVVVDRLIGWLVVDVGDGLVASHCVAGHTAKSEQMRRQDALKAFMLHRNFKPSDLIPADVQDGMNYRLIVPNAPSMLV
jgi:hypothetical protein